MLETWFARSKNPWGNTQTAKQMPLFFAGIGFEGKSRLEVPPFSFDFFAVAFFGTVFAFGLAGKKGG